MERSFQQLDMHKGKAKTQTEFLQQLQQRGKTELCKTGNSQRMSCFAKLEQNDITVGFTKAKNVFAMYHRKLPRPLH